MGECCCFQFPLSEPREMRNGGQREALAVCSDKNMGSGITIWDVETGNTLLHIPTCASPPYGLICLRNEFLVASQTRKEGSVGGGSVFIWYLNKPQPPLRSYPLEPIGPLASTKDSVYLAGGALSGNIHLWEVGSGKLLKLWSGHHKPIKCILFSWDDSFLITGSTDGMICVWSMIGLLDVEHERSSQPILYYLMEHKSSLTGLLTMSGCASIIISSSLDGSLKIWDLLSGMIMGSQAHTEGITAIVLHPTEQLLFSGSVDGQIFASRLQFGLDNCIAIKESQLLAPKGHKGAITALAFSRMDLISAAEDCTVCIWDISSQRIIQKLDHKKGRITNLVAIPWPSLISTSNRKRALNHFSVTSLDKYPQPANFLKSTIPLFPPLHPLEENRDSLRFTTSTDSLNQQIFDMKTEGTSAAIQMKVETSLESRILASRITKHVMEMNNHLQSRLLDMMRIRLFEPAKINSPAKKRKDKRDRVAGTREKQPSSFH